MKTTYLLPCACGEKLQVDASESGLVMKCRCGASLEVPTLRGLARLEPVVVDEPPSARRAWGGAQRGMAIGALIALLGLGLAIAWTVKPLPQPQDVFNDDELQRLGLRRNEEAQMQTPEGVMDLYAIVQQQGLVPGDPKLVERYRQEQRVHVWWRVASYITSALGLAILGASVAVYWMGRSGPSRRRPLVAASG